MKKIYLIKLRDYNDRPIYIDIEAVEAFGDNFVDTAKSHYDLHMKAEEIADAFVAYLENHYANANTDKR